MELFKLLGTIAINNDAANKALDDTSNKADRAGKKTETAFAKIGGAALNVAKVVGGAALALGGAWVAAIEGTREYRTQMGMLDTAFQTAGHSSEAAKQTYSDLNAVLGDSGQATEAAQHLAKLTDSEKDLQTWTDICTGVYATFGEALPIESLAEASNETAKTGQLTGGLTDALNWAGISEVEFQKKLDACSNEQERQKLIMDTLNGTYAKASEQYKKTNKDVMDAQRAQEKLTDAFSQLGAVGEPILTAIKTKVADMVTAAVPHIQNFIIKIKDMKKWIKDNKGTIDTWKAAIVGTAASVASFILMLKWGAIMSAASTAVKGVTVAVKALNVAMKANLIGLVISLVIGLVAAFITLWKNNEQFRNFWVDLWKKIKSAGSSAIDYIKNKFNDLKSALKTVRNVFENIKDTISDKINGAKEAVSNAIRKIKGLFPLSIGKIFSNLKIPKISVSGGKAPFGIGGAGKLPSFSIKWNAEGGILTKPTIFGLTGNTLLGGGEAGKEAIAPIDTLQGYIKTAVQGENGGIIRTIIEQNKLLMDFLFMTIPKDVLLDTGALVGSLTPGIDMALSNRYRQTKRGNTR